MVCARIRLAPLGHGAWIIRRHLRDCALVSLHVAHGRAVVGALDVHTCLSYRRQR